MFKSLLMAGVLALSSPTAVLACPSHTPVDDPSSQRCAHALGEHKACGHQACAQKAKPAPHGFVANGFDAPTCAQRCLHEPALGCEDGQCQEACEHACQAKASTCASHEPGRHPKECSHECLEAAHNTASPDTAHCADHPDHG